MTGSGWDLEQALRRCVRRHGSAGEPRRPLWRCTLGMWPPAWVAVSRLRSCTSGKPSRARAMVSRTAASLRAAATAAGVAVGCMTAVVVVGCVTEGPSAEDAQGSQPALTEPLVLWTSRGTSSASDAAAVFEALPPGDGGARRDAQRGAEPESATEPEEPTEFNDGADATLGDEVRPERGSGAGEPRRMLSLWPPERKAPQRMKHGVRTARRGAWLEATTEQRDPWLWWSFEPPLRAGVVLVELELERPGLLQLFWSSRACPVFTEPCSAKRWLQAGRHSVHFSSNPRTALRELRLDLPEALGARVRIRRIVALDRSVQPLRWDAESAGSRVTSDAAGLHLASTTRDPWLVIETPGLDAAAARQLALTLGAPAGARPQLFWRGAECPSFSEACSARLDAAEAGTVMAYRIDLGALEHWRGLVEALRLDPGDGTGEYLLETLSLAP